ncbi:winged helix-turn-helix transcriptional regulator [Halanaerobaculum tunisiense]
MVVLKYLTPSSKLKKVLLLKEIAKDPNISQSELADKIGVVPSMVNNYIKQFVEEGLLEKEVQSSRNMKYYLTTFGQDYKDRNLFAYMIELEKVYKKTRKEVKNNLMNLLVQEEINKVVCYGAGEAASVAILSLKEMNLSISGIVDDDQSKQGSYYDDYLIQSPDKIKELNPDAIVITTIMYRQEIYEKIKEYENEGIKVIQI